MRRVAEAATATSGPALAEALLAEARAIHDEDRAMCAAMGRHGADMLADLPEGALESTFARMQAGREQEATTIRAQGERNAQIIRAEAHAQARPALGVVGGAGSRVR